MKSRKISSEDRIILLGSSRGLGWQTYQSLREESLAAAFLMSSRKIQERKDEVTEKTLLSPQDFSTGQVAESFLQTLTSFSPTRLIYFAGGGPHGIFEQKKWADHQWALNTSFLYPAQLLHKIISDFNSWPRLQQIIFIGSAIAEKNADANAASYAAAKHGLKGLITSVQKESSAKPEILLFSPGYMQTDLLPANSQPRQNGSAESPDAVAKKLIAFIEKSD
jgi:short-subunit dehydrogenase